MGVETAVLAAAVASAAMQGYNQYNTAKRQDKSAARNIKDQAELQRQANARMAGQLDKLETSKPDDEFQERSADIRKQLRAKQMLGLAGIQNTGGGEAVTGMAEEGRGKAIDYGDFINEVLSGIDAPLMQRQGERYEFADTGADLQKIQRNSAQRNNLMRMQMAGYRDNPWLTMASQALGAYASAGAPGFGGGNTMAGAGGLSNLGGQTPQQFYAPNAYGIPGMARPLQGNPYGIGSIFGNGKIGG